MKNKSMELPFIQFFSGWKWKDVLCHDNIVLFHGNDSVSPTLLAPERKTFDFSDTPAETLGETTMFGFVSSWDKIEDDEETWAWGTLTLSEAL